MIVYGVWDVDNFKTCNNIIRLVLLKLPIIYLLFFYRFLQVTVEWSLQYVALKNYSVTYPVFSVYLLKLKCIFDFLLKMVHIRVEAVRTIIKKVFLKLFKC